jgi:nucleotide-binding universal stress UspA family protein
MIRLKTILHPTDFSECSRYALELACALARDQAARVILLHVVPRPAPAAGSGDVPAFKEEHASGDYKTYRDEMIGRLGRLRDEASYAQVESLFKEGDVASAITSTAEERACDLIVLGTHGKSRMHQVMMGSVVAAVTRTAPCPVVTVKVPLPSPQTSEQPMPGNPT